MPSLLDGTASSSHFLDHLAPVVDALGDDFGSLWVHPKAKLAAQRNGVRAHVTDRRMPNRPGRPVLIASWGEIPKLRGRPPIMIEHGSGQLYGPQPPADTRPDAHDPSNLLAMLCPNEAVAHRNRLHHPRAVVEVVGSAKVEAWAKMRARDHYPEGLPVVAFAWHWASDLHPCARWAFPHWFRAIEQLAAIPDEQRGFRLLGHGHPRAWPMLKSFYLRARIPATNDPAEVIRRADLVCFDSTSFGWESAACGIPVVLLDAPHFDTGGREFGLRFWECADAGLRIGSGKVAELHEAITETLASDPCATRRAEVAHAVYGPLEGSAQRSADLIRRALADRC